MPHLKVWAKIWLFLVIQSSIKSGFILGLEGCCVLHTWNFSMKMTRALQSSTKTHVLTVISCLKPFCFLLTILIKESVLCWVNKYTSCFLPRLEVSMLTYGPLVMGNQRSNEAEWPRQKHSKKQRLYNLHSTCRACPPPHLIGCVLWLSLQSVSLVLTIASLTFNSKTV